MKGDFTRSTFEPEKHYSSVRKQQGRVEIDADWNEQIEIEAHLRETEAQDIIGPCGAPLTGGGFQIGVKAHLLEQVHFVSATQGWAVGDDAAILATVDGGATWTRQMPLQRTTATLRGLHFFNTLRSWAVGDDAAILATVDGGATWTRQMPPAGMADILHQVRFVSATQGWSVGDNAVILTTTDGGSGWAQQDAPAGVTAGLRGIHLASATQGWIVGDGATILTTSDGGATWTQQAAPAGVTATLHDVQFVSATQGWAVGDNATILTTPDGGSTWTQQTNLPGGVTANLRGVHFVSATQGWAVGDDALILTTSDGGATWTQQAAPAGVTAHLRGVSFVSATQGWSVGENNAILVTSDGGTTWTAQNPPYNLTVSPGRIYVDGILCEQEVEVTYLNQPDYPDAEAITPPAQGGDTDLVFLDVWQRHFTALEDPSIREVALGGPDTATRTRTTWQVNILRVGDQNANVNCLSDLADWNNLLAGSTGRLSARAESSPSDTGPCIVPPGAGYRRLENQLYRVEIHNEGPLGTATFKWSRENGSIVTGWVGQDGDNLIVGSLGRDNVTGFASGDWVELLDDTCELRGEPGTLVQAITVQGDVLTIDPATATGSVNRADFPRNPKVRRWESSGELSVEIPSTNDGWIPLEEGVEVRFEAGSYQTDDYWLIPARTATADVEWPKTATGHPLPQLPEGIRHHYCRLALIQVDAQGMQILDDCRPLFPHLTEMTHLFYISGDGQEAIPGFALPMPLQAGVSNGEWPVADARVRFRVQPPGTGVLRTQPADPNTSTDLIVLTDASGVAECFWQLDATTQSQQVEATLLDAADNPVHLPVRFNANLSVASQVAYDPAVCENLAGVTTVQEAIDRLCQTSDRDPGIHIVEVLTTVGNAPLRNDTDLPVERLVEGIQVICDGAVDPIAIRGKPVCFVTLDVPYPLLPEDRRFWGTQQIVGYQPLILDAQTAAQERTILWLPNQVTMEWIRRLFAALTELELSSRVLAHLTLKGNFIWSQEDPNLYLDGEAFGFRRDEATTDIRLPSGNDRRGGDFEMWFWLIRQQINRGIGLIPVVDSPMLSQPNFSQALSFAINRNQLREFLPADYQIDTTQPFSLARARTIINQLDLPRREIFTLVDMRFIQAAQRVDVMVRQARIALTIIQDTSGDIVQTARAMLSAGQTLDMVISDEDTSDRLTAALPNGFQGMAVRF